MLKLEVSWKGVAVLAASLVALWAVVQVWAVVLLVIVAVIFMAALLPYVEWLCRPRSPRPAAVLLVLFAILAILVGLSAIFAPAMIDEFSSVRDNLPRDAQRL